MAKNSKEAYKIANTEFLEEMAVKPGVKELTFDIKPVKVN